MKKENVKTADRKPEVYTDDKGRKRVRMVSVDRQIVKTDEKSVSKAQQMIQETTHTYEYKKLEKDFTREELFEQFPEARTFPQIRIDGKAIGGWVEFSKI